MNLFRVKSNPQGIDRMAEFLKDNFICIGWPRIGDLDNSSEDEIKKRLAEMYGLSDEELADRLEEVCMFVHIMQDGDYVLVAAEETGSVYLGDLGDYYYVEDADPAAVEEGMCHRRGVTWLNGIPRLELNVQVQEFLERGEAVAKFMQPLAASQLDRWASKLAGQAADVVVGSPVLVDPRLIEEALEILKQALRSDDVERRERAAAAILQYAKH